MRRVLHAPLTRRAFLGGIGALPTLALPAAALSAAAGTPPPSVLYRREPPPIESAEQVVNVMEFEDLARIALPPAHFAYIATGVDDDLTVARNHAAFAHYEIRARRFADLSRIDTTRRVFGRSWPSPLYLSAVSGMGAFHPEGELAAARAAKRRAVQLMLSTGSSVPVEQVASAVGAPYWQQLYPTNEWPVATRIVRRAEDAGCSAIVLTVDSPTPHRNNETLKRAILTDSRPCAGCHKNNSHDMWTKAPMFEGLDVSHVEALAPADLTPAYLDRLRKEVRVKLFAKGIVTRDDATVAVEHGCDAIIVSNHGGRNEETLRATIDCVPEIVSAVGARVPVFVDGGVRRGTDVFKALALGATAVGLGRPQAWGLAAFGQAGVERVIDILEHELADIMRQAGTPTLAHIGAASVLRSMS
jgi:4-hydroxymandelate oxidase